MWGNSKDADAHTHTRNHSHDTWGSGHKVLKNKTKQECGMKQRAAEEEHNRSALRWLWHTNYIILKCVCSWRALNAQYAKSHRWYHIPAQEAGSAGRVGQAGGDLSRGPAHKHFFSSRRGNGLVFLCFRKWRGNEVTRFGVAWCRWVQEHGGEKGRLQCCGFKLTPAFAFLACFIRNVWSNNGLRRTNALCEVMKACWYLSHSPWGVSFTAALFTKGGNCHLTHDTI